MKLQIREVRLVNLFTHSFLSPLLIPLLWIFAIRLPDKYLSADFPLWIFYVLAATLTYPLLKRSVIGLVLLYKVLAPESVRQRCLFTPTCSTYMIMAIYKYGLFIGVYKGIRRLLRCHPPNGGEDYP